jgi:hypothetical protein
MKKYISFFIVLLCGTIKAQDITDAVRYAQDSPTGTARFSAMSGAFGALGGDLSALNINPAGSAIFANGQVAVTLTNTYNSNNASYFGNPLEKNKNSFSLNQLGAVFVFKSQSNKKGWTKFAIAANYDTQSNYKNTIAAFGINPTRSISDYFLYYANGVKLDNLKNRDYEDLGFEAQQAWLGYQSYIINPIDNNDLINENYTSNIPAGGNYLQEYTSNTSGTNGKLQFNAAASYNDMIYFGANINIHAVDFKKSTRFYEDNSNALNSNYQVVRLNFDNDLYTYGSGVSLQLGFIGKLTNEVRIGLSYETPTWYELNDELTQTIVAVRKNTSRELDPDIQAPNTNIYVPYSLRTPSKITASIGLVFAKKGLISLDYSYKDYSKTTFTSSDFDLTNNAIKNTLGYSNALRIGGEYKIEKWSLRGGYQMEQSPYRNKIVMGDLKGYSAGLGYNFGGTKLDFSYTSSKRNNQESFFSNGFSDAARINGLQSRVALTLVLEL